MLFSSLFAPANSVVAITVLLGFSQVANAAVQCDLISSAHCGRNHHKQNHKLPTTPGSTYYIDGFHGGVMNAKFQSVTQSVPGNSDNVDLTYNFNLCDYSGTYWVILPNSFGGKDACYAVYKNCDVTLTFWETSKPYPASYVLA